MFSGVVRVVPLNQGNQVVGTNILAKHLVRPLDISPMQISDGIESRFPSFIVLRAVSKEHVGRLLGSRLLTEICRL